MVNDCVSDDWIYCVDLIDQSVYPNRVADFSSGDPLIENESDDSVFVADSGYSSGYDPCDGCGRDCDCNKEYWLRLSQLS